MEELKQLYNGQVASPLEYYVESAGADRKSFFGILERLRRYCVPASGRLLDIGSSHGTFLQCARDRGWEVCGLEINRQSAACARSQGLRVLESTLEELPPNAGPWELVFMGDVVEHLRDPRDSLSRIHGRLSPGGALVISTPNIDSWAARTFQIKPEEHLFYFSRRTLSRMLAMCGYEVLAMEFFDRYRNLKALRLATTFQAPQTAFTSLVARLIRRCPWDVDLRLPFGENLLAVARKA